MVEGLRVVFFVEGGNGIAVGGGGRVEVPARAVVGVVTAGAAAVGVVGGGTGGTTTGCTLELTQLIGVFFIARGSAL